MNLKSFKSVGLWHSIGHDVQLDDAFVDQVKSTIEQNTKISEIF